MKCNLDGNLGGNKEESPGTLEIPGLSLAEKERFELSLRFTRTTPLAGEPLRPLGYFSIWLDILKKAEREGFEPPVPFSITGFQDQRHQPLGHPSVHCG